MLVTGAGQTGCRCRAGAGQVLDRCWGHRSQVPGRQAAGAGQVLDRCWGHRSQVPVRQAAGAGQVLGRYWTGAGQVLQDAGAGQVPGRCCRCWADRSQVWHTGPEVQGISPISPGYLAL